MRCNGEQSEEVKDSCIDDGVNGVARRQQYHNDDNKLRVDDQQPREHSTDDSTDVLHEPQSTALRPRYTEPLPEYTAVYLCNVVTDRNIVCVRHVDAAAAGIVIVV